MWCVPGVQSLVVRRVVCTWSSKLGCEACGVYLEFKVRL